MNPERPHRGRIPAHWFWPGMVIGLMSISVIAMTTTMVLAVSDPSFAVVEDYEAKAGAWDETAAARRASAELGWTTEISFGESADVYGARDLVVEIAQSDGAAVVGASAQAVAFHPARSRDRQVVDLKEQSPGVYVGSFTPRREGVWEFELSAVRGEERYVEHRQQWLLGLKGR